MQCSSCCCAALRICPVWGVPGHTVYCLRQTVGGNHEAANHLWELYYGGWVAPNIYYLGAAGVVNFGGVRIAGLSGIFNPRHYKQVAQLAALSSCSSSVHENCMAGWQFGVVLCPMK